MNQVAKYGGIGSIVAVILSAMPIQYDFYAAVFIVVCSITSAAVPPPHAGSKWAVLYQIISTIGLNIGWAENHFKPGISALRVSRSDEPAAKEVVKSAGIPVLDKKGKPE